MLVKENEHQVVTVMIAMRQVRAAFADALIASLGQLAWCSHTSGARSGSQNLHHNIIVQRSA